MRFTMKLIKCLRKKTSPIKAIKSYCEECSRERTTKKKTLENLNSKMSWLKPTLVIHTSKLHGSCIPWINVHTRQSIYISREACTPSKETCFKSLALWNQ
jgi:hypothetical protein